MALERPTLYALVIYLPDPLGAFLDHLRLQMVPDCNPHAHISVLPPRTVASPEAAVERAHSVLGRLPEFEIDLGRIEKFKDTDVIYISVERGADQLREMHRTLNHDALSFPEPFVYHPHVTLAQEFDPSQLDRLLDVAARKWRAYPHPRTFRASRAVFVRNPQGKYWEDLADLSLNQAPLRFRD